MKRMILGGMLLAATATVQAQTENMKVVDSLGTTGRLTTIAKGTLVKLSNSHYYEINDKINQPATLAQPNVVVYQDGKKFKMKIPGVDKLLAVNKIQEVIETNIDGNFRGYDGTTKFKLENRQEWQQDSPTSNVFSNLFRPAVVIYLTPEGYKMKIEGLNEAPILVKKL